MLKIVRSSSPSFAAAVLRCFSCLQSCSSSCCGRSCRTVQRVAYPPHAAQPEGLGRVSSCPAPHGPVGRAWEAPGAASPCCPARQLASPMTIWPLRRLMVQEAPLRTAPSLRPCGGCRLRSRAWTARTPRRRARRNSSPASRACLRASTTAPRTSASPGSGSSVLTRTTAAFWTKRRLPCS